MLCSLSLNTWYFNMGLMLRGIYYDFTLIYISIWDSIGCFALVKSLHFVEEFVQGWYPLGETLPFPGVGDDDSRLGGWVSWVVI